LRPDEAVARPKYVPMNVNAYRSYYRTRWPDEIVPEGEPLWQLYEVDEAADNVLRTVNVFPDGRITRNSVELEQRNGDECPSLFDCGWHEGIDGVQLLKISAEAFEELYRQGIDTAFWFVR
jgi:hypothetical protein